MSMGVCYSIEGSRSATKKPFSLGIRQEGVQNRQRQKGWRFAMVVCTVADASAYWPEQVHQHEGMYSQADAFYSLVQHGLIGREVGTMSNCASSI